MKKLLLAAAIVNCFACGAAMAQEAASPVVFNAGVVSDYRYRGISQTRLKPALQGGIDYAHSSGFYVGTWASTIKWIKDAGGDSNIEVDVYGGYKGKAGALSYDVGVLAYMYPSNDLNPSANTEEIYGALSFGPATLKYSHSLSNLFGFADSEGSGYLELNGNFDLGNGWATNAHVGHQEVENNDTFSYTDWKLGVTKDVNGFILGAAVVGTDAGSTYLGPNGKKLGRSGVVLSLVKNF